MEGFEDGGIEPGVASRRDLRGALAGAGVGAGSCGRLGGGGARLGGKGVYLAAVVVVGGRDGRRGGGREGTRDGASRSSSSSVSDDESLGA